MIRRILVLGSLLSIALFAGAGAAPTPVPGGANGVSALSGKIGDTVFNGNLRIKILELRPATDADSQGIPFPAVAAAGQKLMFMRVLLRNGTNDSWFGCVTYTLADKDAVSADVPTNAVVKPTVRILQGASARQVALFAVDKDFVPTKLIIGCSTCASNSGFRPIRFRVPAP